MSRVDEAVALEVLRPGAAPPCLKAGGLICRGCPGWQAMQGALGPLGAWRGALIHCSVTGLTARARAED
ncbi:MAG: hypothetical protein HY794_11010 [Desulfarculus sp.]|nr:hypothetical protein [Desulfarculus sp.]